MKLIKFITILLTTLLFVSCQQLAEPEFSTENSISSIECVVVMESK